MVQLNRKWNKQIYNTYTRDSTILKIASSIYISGHYHKKSYMEYTLVTFVRGQTKHCGYAEEISQYIILR